MTALARLLPLLALLLLAACASAEQAGKSDPIAPDALAERLASGDAPVVLDVRSQGEYDAGHIPGALWIPHDQVASRLSELPDDKDTEIVVHCQSGKRAAVAEEVLREAGYTRVRDLEGHWKQWKEGGYPSE